MRCKKKERYKEYASCESCYIYRRDYRREYRGVKRFGQPGRPRKSTTKVYPSCEYVKKSRAKTIRRAMEVNRLVDEQLTKGAK